MNSIDDFKNRVILGDNVATMKQMPDESVNLVVTSPPYFVDMEYEDIKKGDGHMIANWNRYLNELLFPTFEECYRLLVPGSWWTPLD